MIKKKKNKIFIDGAISPAFIADAIAKHSAKKNIGAHSIFLGQVRNDRVDEKEIVAIEYMAYTEMAEEIFHEIREAAFEKYSLTCLHIHHSLGRVHSGEISLFIFTSSVHRKDAIQACSEVVERIKKEAPVWGKERFTGEDFQWKIHS